MTTPRGLIADTMAWALAREVRDGDVVGVGLGTVLALVAVLAARATVGDGVHVVAGGAVDPAGDLESMLAGAGGMVGRTPGFVPHLDTMDMAERQVMTLQMLRPAQIDGMGNLNTSRIGGVDAPSVRFPGGLATADVPNLLPRLVIYHPDHRPRNLPATVSFVTGRRGGWRSGDYRTTGPVTLVTDLAVIDLTDGPRLVSVHPWASVDRVVSSSGFTLRDCEDAAVTQTPDSSQRAVLRSLDPEGRRLREIPLRDDR